MSPYTIEQLWAEVSAEEYVNTCVDIEKFLGYCRQCHNFGKNWACPPHDFDPMEIWKNYSSLELHARVLIPGEGMTRQALTDAFLAEKKKLSLEVLELEKRIPGSRSLAAGTCVECSPCLKSLGKPCAHPQQVRPSLEAMGADVGKTMELYLHKPILWIQGDQLPEYMTLAAGLLKR